MGGRVGGQWAQVTSVWGWVVLDPGGEGEVGRGR